MEPDVEGSPGVRAERLMTKHLMGRYKTQKMLVRAGNNQGLNIRSPNLNPHLQYCGFLQAQELGFDLTEEWGEIPDSMVVIYDLEIRMGMRFNFRKRATFLVNLSWRAMSPWVKGLTQYLIQSRRAVSSSFLPTVLNWPWPSCDALQFSYLWWQWQRI